jgi:hypothetical protein
MRCLCLPTVERLDDMHQPFGATFVRIEEGAHPTVLDEIREAADGA